MNSAVFRWPDRETVLGAARRWASALRRRDSTVWLVGCIGSYARGDWGVGSDLDVIVVLAHSSLSRAQRYARYYPDDLPVPADLWVYTQAEGRSLEQHSAQLWQRIQRELVTL